MSRTVSAMTVLLLSLTMCFTPQQGVRAQRKSTPLKVEGDTLVVVKSLPCKVTAPYGATLYDWSYPDTVKGFPEDNTLTIISAPKGSFVVRVRMTTIDFEKKKVDRETGEIEVNYGGVPTPPDPGPKPPPDPPGPQPGAPIAIDGFAVLMVYESKTASELPMGQQAVLFGKRVRDVLKAKCVKGTGNENGAYRIYDKDVVMDGESKAWRDAMLRKRDSVPWIVISTGRTGYEGPLPSTEEEAVNLLNKYADVKKVRGDR